MTKNTASGFTNQHETRLEKLARDKHSSLFQKFKNFGQKSFEIYFQDKLEKTTSELRRAQAELRLNQSDYERSHVELEQMQEKVNKA